jgi:predicted amidohydrolase
MPKVAAVQMHLFRSETVAEFRSKLEALVSQAARRGAELVALPAHVGLCLFQADLTDLRANPLDLTRATRGGLRQTYEIHCGELAAKYNVYLAAGTAYIAAGERVYHVAYVFGPDGRVAGAQAQTHRSPRDRAWGLDLADALGIIETPVGRIGLVVGEDARYPEVARILCLQGANILIHPGEHTQAAGEERLALFWREVQANQVFGLEPAIVGRLAAQDLVGPATIYAPCEMTPGQAGVLAEASTPDENEIVTADLDFHALQDTLAHYDVYRYLNVDLVTRQLAPAMESFRGGRL